LSWVFVDRIVAQAFRKCPEAVDGGSGAGEVGRSRNRNRKRKRHSKKELD